MKNRIFSVLFFGISLCGLCSAALGEIIVYPAPQGVDPSEQYTLEVSQEDAVKSPFVYVTHAQIPQFNRSETTSFSMFSFTGRIQVRVTKLKGEFQTCSILPTSYGIQARKQGNSVVFELDRPRKVAVEFDGDITHPMLVFADPPETDIPSPNDPNVLYFGPGLHEPEDTIQPKPGQTVYLAGGAIVQAMIRGENVPRVTIRGRGILSGRKFGHTHGRHILFTGSGSADITVEDITILDSPGFFVTTDGPRTQVRNIKGIGWWFNTDGVATGENGRVEDCFLKCNDDAVKLYRSGMKVFRTTIWQMENGAPFQISWNMGGDNRGFVVRDCDVIHCDHRWDNTNEAVFDSIHGGGGHMSDYLFEDIRIENADWRLVSFQILRNKFARSRTLGTISNLTFRNISVTTSDGGPMRRCNLIQGIDEDGRISAVSRITFENLKINGQYVHNAEQGRFEIEPRTTSGIRFTVTAEDAAQKPDKKPKKTDKKAFAWTNPITDGLNSYGQKDFHILSDKGTWYLTATEMPNPEWGKRGCILYASEDLLQWREEAYLFNRNSLDKDAWYRDEWAAPEIHKIKGKYYLTFNCRNNTLRPYKKLGFGIASSDDIKGPYQVLTPDQPLALGNNAALFEEQDGRVYAYWDMDGRFYAAQMDLEKAKFKTEPREILGPDSLGEDYRFLDAPFVMRKDDTIHMISSSFYSGYVVRVRALTAENPMGPWKLAPEPLMTFIESQADETLKMPYSAGYTFAPPTQVIFHHQIFLGPGERYYIAYHSSEKYSEPYLVIEPVEFDSAGRITILNHNEPKQKVVFD